MWLLDPPGYMFMCPGCTCHDRAGADAQATGDACGWRQVRARPGRAWLTGVSRVAGRLRPGGSDDPAGRTRSASPTAARPRRCSRPPAARRHSGSRPHRRCAAARRAASIRANTASPAYPPSMPYLPRCLARPRPAAMTPGDWVHAASLPVAERDRNAGLVSSLSSDIRVIFSTYRTESIS